MNLATLNEIAPRLGVSPNTLRRWCREGLGGSYPPARRLGGRWKIDRDRLGAWVSEVSVRAGDDSRGNDAPSETAELIAEIINKVEKGV